MPRTSHWPIGIVEALSMPRGLLCRNDDAVPWLTQSAQKARAARKNLSALLSRAKIADDFDRSEADEIIRKLNRCSNTAPCLSGPCPVCQRALQRLFVHLGMPIMQAHERYQMVTCVSGDAGISAGKLDGAALLLERRRAMGFARASNSRIFGAIDVSLNENKGNILPTLLWPHSHFLRLNRLFAIDDPSLIYLYPKSLHVRIPVLAKPYDGRPNAIAYALRPLTERRISLLREPNHRTRWTVRDKPLISNQRVELALALDQAGIEARPLLIGYELRTNGCEVWLGLVSLARAEEIFEAECKTTAARHSAYLARKRTHQALQLDLHAPRRPGGLLSTGKHV